MCSTSAALTGKGAIACPLWRYNDQEVISQAFPQAASSSRSPRRLTKVQCNGSTVTFVRERLLYEPKTVMTLFFILSTPIAGLLH